jgi:putative cell wall-binding protein
VLAGADRIATAIATSQDAFGPLTAQVVVIARSDGFADALAGTALAVAKDGPLLLTPTASLDARVEAEVKRVLAPGGTVYLLGGPDALSPTIEAALTADGYTVVRLGASNRFGTAVNIAGLMPSSTVLLATGMTAADALVAGAAAARAGAVVLLTNDGVMPPETAAYLASHSGDTVYAIGGPAAAADQGALSILGGTRYKTAVLVAQAFFGSPEAIGFASGTSYADALAGGVHIGLHGGPLLLLDPAGLDPDTRAYLNAVGGGVLTAWAYGGPAAIAAALVTAASNALGGA